MKRLTVIMGVLLVAILLLPLSCARSLRIEQAPVVPRPAPVPAPMPVPAPAPPEERVEIDRGVLGKATPDTLSSLAEERMIIRNGELSLIVRSVVDTRDEIARLAVRLQGYVVSSWVSGEKEEMRGQISLRVPDDRFEEALAQLRKLAVRVESESTSSRDVTEEYVDLEARLKNAQATESQYVAILNKATTVEDILRVYDSLSRVRREIEQIKGRMKYLERTSSMSLIGVSLRPVTTTAPLVPVGWHVLEVLKSAIRGVVTLGQWLVTLVIWLIMLAPIWGTVLGIFLWRRRRKKVK